VRYTDCGLLAYRQALALQQDLVGGIAEGSEEETLLLLEHPSVYTIGRSGQLTNVLDPGLTVERINRGGDITWHGPGQLVGYPLINLAARGRDLHRWMRFLEEVLIVTLHEFGIQGESRAGTPGIWTKQGKIAFLGVGVRRWISMHGFSLNVCPDMRAFGRINPCGHADCPVTSMSTEGVAPPEISAVKQQVLHTFSELLPKRLPVVAFRQRRTDRNG
jgi:lipoyl(octanoyl) transferase